MSDTEGSNPAGATPPAAVNPLTIAINIFASPGDALRDLRDRPTILFPLLVTIISTAVVYAWYFQFVDYAWYVDDIISRMGNLQDAQQDQIREALNAQSRNVMTVTSTLGGMIGVVFILALPAGYLSLVSALSGDRYRFRHWFSLVSWTGLPYLLVVLVMAVNILMSPNGQLSIYDANSLSLASLGFSAEGNTVLQATLEALNLPMFWSIGLTILGYHQWVGSSWLRAAVTVLAPYMVIFCTLAYFAFT